MGRGQKKVNDEILFECYSRLGNVWKVAMELGMGGQAVHERLRRAGKIKRVNVFSDEERNILKGKYVHYRDAGALDDLAKQMGRTKQFICRKAKEMGLTDQKARKPYAEKTGSNPYAKYHARVRSLRGSPHKCEVCGESNPRKWYDWANLTGRYEDPSDYKRMCRDCHREHDK